MPNNGLKSARKDKVKKYKFIENDDEELNFEKEKPVGTEDPSFPSSGGHRNLRKVGRRM